MWPKNPPKILTKFKLLVSFKKISSKLSISKTSHTSQKNDTTFGSNFFSLNFSFDHKTHGGLKQPLNCVCKTFQFLFLNLFSKVLAGLRPRATVVENNGTLALDFETGWTGELWSNANLLKWQN